MRKRDRKQIEQADQAEVNVTPLADVSLTLVIMMMVISPMVFQSIIQVQAAQAVATKTNERVQEKPIFLDITRTGFTVNNSKVKTEYALYRILQKNLARKDDKTVLITSASNVKYHKVVRILDLVKQTGATNLSLVPRKKA